MILKTYLENLKPAREYVLWTILKYWRKSWNPALGTFETSFKAKQMYMYSYIWARKVSTSVDFRAFSSTRIKVYSFC